MYRKCLRRGKVSHKILTDGIWYIWELGYKVNFNSDLLLFWGFGVVFLFSPVKRRQFRECLGASLLYFGGF